MSLEKIYSREKNKFLFKIVFIVIIIIITLSFTSNILFTTTTTPTKTTITSTTPLPILPPSFDSEEKFLTYLPHDEFHHQRQALMNAIMLSYITNRTLIIPPILIYYVPRATTFYPLYNALNTVIKAKKYREEHCYKDDMNDGNDVNVYSTHSFCDNTIYSKYNDFTMLNWDQLFDFNELKKHVKIVNRGYDFSLESLKYNFNIGENDTYLLIENRTFELEFFDNNKSIRKINEDFKKKFFISDLLKVDKKLLHLSSLFSFDKIVLEKKENIKFRQFIHNKLMINDSKILNISEKIIKLLGGKGNYIGIHIRVRGGIFRVNEVSNVGLIYGKLMKYLLKSNLLKNSTNLLFNYSLKECLEYKLPTIYIATDTGEPRQRFSKFYNSIPCVFTLYDFSKVLQDFGNGKLTSDYDEDIELRSFYGPIIDLLVTSHGKTFFGTPKSAFSTAASELNNLYNGKNAI
ncbi:hypothetical protein RclHR1_02430005 [Rhizophagus clarus]|uniref:GDP-fucose protein O-fucosyltransferase n=1 Tax=Rhizophagus clarus TaxID=94130 RepID=A0A2Z6RAH2_9GLOM|nr:hypothetical protein RclHR1_02430005 [Rhizophagus clarus]GET02519.1 GDP-fucose protein O-fucosyltransferase [Rhizophagus clarus]